MERANLEARFTERSRTLEASKVEIGELLGRATLSERDRVRLTRVLQLVERYRPARAAQSDPFVRRWLGYLQTAFRSLPALRRQRPDAPEHDAPKSYLLAEEAIASLRALRHLDARLEAESSLPDDEVLDQVRPDEVESREVLDTSLTLEYEKKNWGVERICLDGIQNHLPTDSKGERVWVRCLVGGEWVTLAEARQRRDEVEAVRFADDGVGFDVQNLALLYSTKADEPESRGQFGEGLKMMAAAALREGLEPELESQGWRARPVAKQVKLTDHRQGRERDVQRLAFEVEHLAGPPMVGSRTTFHRPTQAFINELMEIESKVLALRDGYHPAFIGTVGEIVDREAGGIFVKGIYVTGRRTLLSYNFDDVETNRDRNVVLAEGLDSRIAQIVGEISDRRLVKTILQKALLDPDAIESRHYNLQAQHPSVWLESFREAFGPDAVLDTGFKVPVAFADRPLNRVKLPSGLAGLLLRAGVRTDREATPDSYDEVITTSLTLEYGKDVWDEERIMLDAVQNHLPKDSGGSFVGLRFRTTDGRWHPYDELATTPDEAVTALKVYDNGRGYDPKLLGLFFSTKGNGVGTGKFGEGLKMLCLASLRRGVDIALRSQNWSARPRALRQDVGGNEVEQMVFDVTHAVKQQEMDDDRQVSQTSSTTFSNPTPELLREFREVSGKVLALERKKPFERTSRGDLLSLEGGSLYVRELLIPGDHGLAFAYHLPEFEIMNRDRNTVGAAELAPELAAIWSEVESPEAVKSYLFRANREAQQGEGQGKLEFGVSFTPRNAETWRRCFTEVFGEETAVRDVRSEDFDAVHQNLHVGLSVVTFPPAVCDTISRLGLPSYAERVREMTDVEHIPPEELTAEEQATLRTLVSLDAYLPMNRPSGLRVYEPRRPGQRVAAGFADGTDVHLLRSVVQALPHAADVYVHEKVHHNTGGALDASAKYRNYLTLALSALALEQLARVRPDLLGPQGGQGV